VIQLYRPQLDTSTTTHSFAVQNPIVVINMKMFSFVRFLRRRRTYRSVVQELSSYSDHELQDIGIYRANIYEIARRMSQEEH
jgi:uncharacterized protein YjiS (DUF1127 family)